MFDMILSVLTGGATGILGSLLSTGISFLNSYAEERKEAARHLRTIEMHRLNAELKAQDDERALESIRVQTAGELKVASYAHEQSIGKTSRWVANTLRMVRPVLTGGLIVLIALIYFTIADFGMQAEIVSSVLYMASTAVLWWFGDAVRRKN